MIQGTTPTHTFTLPFNTDQIRKVKVIYAQDDVVLFTKEGEACALEDNVIRVRLTQEETFLFDCQKYVQIQVRILTHADEALVSDPKLVQVEDCLDHEVME